MEGKVDVLLTIIEEIWQNTISSLPSKIKCHQNQITWPRVTPCSNLEIWRRKNAVNKNHAIEEKNTKYTWKMSENFLSHLSWFLLDLLPRIILKRRMDISYFSKIVFPLLIFQPWPGWQTPWIWPCLEYIFSKSSFQHPTFHSIVCSFFAHKVLYHF